MLCQDSLNTSMVDLLRIVYVTILLYADHGDRSIIVQEFDLDSLVLEEQWPWERYNGKLIYDRMRAKLFQRYAMFFHFFIKQCSVDTQRSRRP